MFRYVPTTTTATHSQRHCVEDVAGAPRVEHRLPRGEEAPPDKQTYISNTYILYIYIL